MSAEPVKTINAVPEWEIVVDNGVRYERFKCYSFVDGKVIWTHMGLVPIDTAKTPTSPVDNLRTDARSTRRQAVDNHRTSGAMSRQATRVVELMRDGKGRTRNEIARDSGITLQAVCGRVAELFEIGRLHVGAVRPCTCSGINAQELRLVEQQELAA